jgi:caa(3)-type oxidase subunit IV
VSSPETIEEEFEPAYEHAHVRHLPDRGFIGVAILLGVLTLIEVSTYFWDYGGFATPLLLTLMVVKFAIVVAYFMNLRFDFKLLTFVFCAGLLLAVGVYLAVLATFQYFD